MGTAVMKALSARRTSPLPSVKSWTLMFSRNGAAPGVELLYEFTDWWGDGEKATDDAEGRIEAQELMGRKLLAHARVQRKGRDAEAERLRAAKARQKTPRPEKK